MRLRSDLAYGTITDDPLLVGATTVNSAELSRLSKVVGSPDIMAITLDPRRVNGEPEIIHVTTYDGSATSATILRGQEGTVAREHPLGTEWAHIATVKDLNSGNVLGGSTTNANSLAGHPTATTTGDGSNVALGAGASATGGTWPGQERSSVAVGKGATTTSMRGVAVGGPATVGDSSVAVGSEASATLGSSVAIGRLAVATTGNGGGAVAIGVNANAASRFYSGQSRGGVAIGQSSAAEVAGVAIGNQAKTQTSTGYMVAIGDNAKAAHDNSVALGAATSTTQTYQVMIGPRDLEITGITKGIVLVDRTLGTRHRVYLDNGALVIEAA